MITTPQECTGEHPQPVSSLLKGLIRRKNNEKTNLSNAATENKLANRHHAETSCQASGPCQKNKAKGPQVDYQELQKTTKGTTTTIAMVPRPEVRYLWYPCGSLGVFL